MDRQRQVATADGGGDRGAVVDEPLYNIGVVARMTGIPVATLRVWERRYGFPAAARTAGGHRIYSGHEVQRLRWVKARVAEGMQAGKAVHAMQVMMAQDSLPEPDVADPLRGPPEAATSSLGIFHQRLTEALLAHDLGRADQVIGDVLAVLPVEAVVLGVIRPTLADLGEGWSTGQVSVATEHLASHYLRQRLMLWLAAAPPPRPVPPVVLACAPGEWHDTSLLMFGVLLSRRRWPIAYLGQAVPLTDLADFVATIRPAAVVLVAMHAAAAEALVDWPRALPDVAASGQPALGYGGRVFAHDASWRQRVPGIYLGDTLELGLTTVEEVMVGYGQGLPQSCRPPGQAMV